MGSFTQVEEIIDSGIAEGRKLYPRLKALADSLNTLYGPEPPRQPFAATKNVFITDYEVRGLNHTTENFFIHTMGLLTHRYYTPQQLSQMIRREAGTRYYNRIVYFLDTLPGNQTKIIFDVTENPLSFGKVSLHYNQFSGISAILNLTTRDFFTPSSRSLATIDIGENFRIRGEHLQYFGRGRKFAATASLQFDQFNITTYNNTKEAGIYNQNYFVSDIRFGYSTNRNIGFGAGTRFEWTRYKPSISPTLAFSGTNNFPTSYLYFRHNSLDKPVYPHRGVRLDLEGDWVYTQNPGVVMQVNNQDIDTAVSNTAYPRLMFHFEGYTPLSRRSTILTAVQSGINFDASRNIMNEFSIGGLTYSFHNQITFAGLREGSYYSNSLAAAELGYRYQLYNNVFLTGRIDMMYNNFLEKSQFYQSPNFLSGYALTFTYNFALGPLELSAMYCDQWKRVMGYVNIGIPF
ncbi:MAG TPA: hypothetical protein VG890_17130, partial [Puia sp.]|nr:hypothetical protein [Puia sp.]